MDIDEIIEKIGGAEIDEALIAASKIDFIDGDLSIFERKREKYTLGLNGQALLDWQREMKVFLDKYRNGQPKEQIHPTKKQAKEQTPEKLLPKQTPPLSDYVRRPAYYKPSACSYAALKTKLPWWKTLFGYTPKEQACLTQLAWLSKDSQPLTNKLTAIREFVPLRYTNLQTGESLLLDQLLELWQSAQGHDYHLFVGGSGMGKTTSLYRLYVRYLKRTRGLHIVFWSMEQGWPSFEDIDEETQGKSLLIIDAVDEYAPALDRPDAFWPAIEADTHAFAKVVLGVRRQYFDKHLRTHTDFSQCKIPKSNRSYTHWEIEKLRYPTKEQRGGEDYDPSQDDSEAVRTFLQQKFPLHKGENQEKYKKALQLVERHPNKILRPFFLSQIEKLLHFADQAEANEQQMVKKLIDDWVTNEAGIIGKQDQDRKRFRQDILRFSEALAAELFLRDKQTEIEAQSLEYFKNEQTWLAPWLGSKHINDRSLLEMSPRHTLRFAHREFREYFLALALWNGTHTETDFFSKEKHLVDKGKSPEWKFYSHMCQESTPELAAQNASEAPWEQWQEHSPNMFARYFYYWQFGSLPSWTADFSLLNQAWNQWAQGYAASNEERFGLFWMQLAIYATENSERYITNQQLQQEVFEHKINDTLYKTWIKSVDEVAAPDTYAFIHPILPEFLYWKARINGYEEKISLSEFRFSDFWQNVHNWVEQVMPYKEQLRVRFNRLFTYQELNQNRDSDRLWFIYIKNQMEAESKGIVPTLERYTWQCLQKKKLHLHTETELPETFWKALPYTDQLEHLHIDAPNAKGIYTWLKVGENITQDEKETLLPNVPFSAPKMVNIEGGEFMMGDDASKNDREKPAHKVTVASFAMAEAPVTLEEFAAFINETEYKTTSEQEGWSFHTQDKDNLGLGWGSWGVSWKYNMYGKLRASEERKHPVLFVSWYDALHYCNYVSRKLGRSEYYQIDNESVTVNPDSNGVRLPSEAQWEYAAGGGVENRTKYAGADNENKLENYAWYRENSDYETHPVKEKKPNPLGLYDMSGNVWEWCEDNYHENYDEAPDDGSAWINENREGLMLLRGGSWDNDADFCRVASRSRYNPDDRDYDAGFRIIHPVS